MARADKVGEGFGGGGSAGLGKLVKNIKGTYAQKKAYKAKVTTPAKKVVAAAKAEAKANARGLKAAQATPSKRNAGVAYSKDAIKNAAPARPNRVRGGSIKSKQNWPEGMKKPKPSLADPKVAEAKRKADAAARLKRLDYNSRNGIF